MNTSLPKRVLYYGKDEPLPEQVALRAGPVSLIYEAGGLRYIRLGQREIIRRIYAALRDRNWGTIHSVISNPKLQIANDSFAIRYTSEHKQEGIDFFWRGNITGDESGTIRFTFDGEARSTFWKNRIGFCVLHPIRECAGAPIRVEYVDGRSAIVNFTSTLFEPASFLIISSASGAIASVPLTWVPVGARNLNWSWPASTLGKISVPSCRPKSPTTKPAHANDFLCCIFV